MKRRIVARVTAMCMTALMIMGSAFLPAQGKTVKTLVTTSEKMYSKNDAGKWFLSNSQTNNYNKKGLYVGFKLTSYLGDSIKQTTKEKVSLDSKGRSKTSKYYTDGKLRNTNKYSYNGSKTTIKSYNAKNKLYSKTIIEAGKSKTTEKSYNAKGKLTDKTTTTFKNKKPIKRTSSNYNSKGKALYTSTVTYKYSGGFTIVKTKNSGPSSDYNNSSEEKYKYDKAGNQITSYQKNYDASGKLTEEYTYQYEYYTSGKAKGCVKTEVELLDGKESRKSNYTVKQIKQTVK